MIIYGTFKNYNEKFILEDTSIGLTIDGVQFELKKDLGYFNGVNLCKDADIFLDFSEGDYSNNGYLRSFRLKEATIMVDGKLFEVSDNSNIVYNVLKNSKLTEIVTYGYDLHKPRKLKMLGSIEFLIGSKVLNFKTNKVSIL